MGYPLRSDMNQAPDCDHGPTGSDDFIWTSVSDGQYIYLNQGTLFTLCWHAALWYAGHVIAATYWTITNHKTSQPQSFHTHPTPLPPAFIQPHYLSNPSPIHIAKSHPPTPFYHIILYQPLNRAIFIYFTFLSQTNNLIYIIIIIINFIINKIYYTQFCRSSFVLRLCSNAPYIGTTYRQPSSFL